MDLNKLPKQFCENVVAGHSQENFVMLLQVGEHATAYALTPEHMKRLVRSLVRQLEEYEKEFGAIDTRRSLGIKSPIQLKDVGGGK
jgi:hypothetical protein